MNLISGVYMRLFTVRHSPSPIGPTEAICDEADKKGYIIEASKPWEHTGPFLPTDRTIAAQIVWNYMRLDEPLVEVINELFTGNIDGFIGS